jgi:hypothetical protein
MAPVTLDQAALTAALGDGGRLAGEVLWPDLLDSKST